MHYYREPEWLQPDKSVAASNIETQHRHNSIAFLFLWVETLHMQNIKVMLSICFLRAAFSAVQWCLYVHYIDIPWLLLIFYRLLYYLFLWKRGIHPDKIQNIALIHNRLKITIFIYTDSIYSVYSWKSAHVQTVFHICIESKTIVEHLISIHWLHL